MQILIDLNLKFTKSNSEKKKYEKHLFILIRGCLCKTRKNLQKLNLIKSPQVNNLLHFTKNSVQREAGKFTTEHEPEPFTC